MTHRLLHVHLVSSAHVRSGNREFCSIKKIVMPCKFMQRIWNGRPVHTCSNNCNNSRIYPCAQVGPIEQKVLSMIKMCCMCERG